MWSSLLGRTREELGGSEYLAVMHDQVRGAPPWIDLDVEKRRADAWCSAAPRGPAALGARRRGRRSRGGARGVLHRPVRTRARRAHRARGRASAPTRCCSAKASRASSCRCAGAICRASGRSRAREDVPITVIGEVRGQRLEIGDLIDRRRWRSSRDVWRGALELRFGWYAMTRAEVRPRSIRPCSIAFAKSAASSASSATPRRRTSSTSALYALQHRGQEAAGIVSADGHVLVSHRGMGLVADIFDEDIIRRLEGRGGDRPQPLLHVRLDAAEERAAVRASSTAAAALVALAHNGNLVNPSELRARLEARRLDLPVDRRLPRSSST